MSKVKFTTTIDQDILEKAKIQAIKEKTSVAKIIEKLLTEYLSNKSEALTTMLLGFAIVSIIINLVLFIAIVCTAINTSKTNKELQEIKQILIDEKYNNVQ